MTTTALFIELLLTGLQAALWIVLIVFSLFGLDWIHLDRIKGFEAIAAIPLFPLVYPLGVFIDYLADEMLKHWDQRLRSKHIPDKTQSAMKLLINTKDVSLAGYLGYTRSRI